MFAGYAERHDARVGIEHINVKQESVECERVALEPGGLPGIGRGRFGGLFPQDVSAVQERGRDEVVFRKESRIAAQYDGVRGVAHVGVGQDQAVHEL